LIGGGDFGEILGAEQLCGEYHYFLVVKSFRLAFESLYISENLKIIVKEKDF